MPVLSYLATSLAYSGLWLIVGAALTELGVDLGSIISGRRNHDDT